MTLSAPQPSNPTDPFDSVLTLEDQLYRQGHAQGTADGAPAGRSEGRALGLERGFEKFLEAGRLHGRALVWAKRLERSKAVVTAEKNLQGGACALPPLETGSGNEGRLARHLRLLHALVEPETLDMQNTDAAVDEFDDRVRRARGKAKVIGRMVGEEV